MNITTRKSKSLALFLALLVVIVPTIGSASDDPPFVRQAIEIEPQSAAAVGVFFAGVAVAFLIDGVVVYTTGYSSAFWVSQGIGFVHNELVGIAKTVSKTVRSIFVQESGAICVQGFCRMPYSISESNL